MAKFPETVLVTGASSGMGRALAVAYSKPGRTLILIGRDVQRLEEVAENCRSLGAAIEIGAIDVRDRQRMHEFILRMDDRHQVDLLIANAGVSTLLSRENIIEDHETTLSTFEINVFGVINAVQPIIQRMCARGAGQIALMGSMAALHGLPYAPAYCATKSAIHLYAESLRSSLSKYGVLVSLIIPGFVSTPFNAHLSAPKPMAMSAERAAIIIQQGLRNGKAQIIFPRMLYFVIRALLLLPSELVDAILIRVAVSIRDTDKL